MRRLPIFFLLDVSESMVGDNLRQLQVGLERLVKATAPTPTPWKPCLSCGLRGQTRTLAPLNGACHVLPPRLPIGAGHCCLGWRWST